MSARLASLLVALAGVTSVLGACQKTPREQRVTLHRDAGAKPPLFGDDDTIDAAPRHELAIAGEQVFLKYCALCHGAEGRGYAADNAPSLVSNSFLASASDEFIIGGIRDGRPGSSMAGYGTAHGGPLDDTQIKSVVVFLREHGPAPIKLAARPAGDATRGAPLYEATCKVCHGDPTTKGTAVNLAHPTFLAQAGDPFLRHAIVHGREGTKMVPLGGARLDDQQIDDLVALLRSWAGSAVLTPPDPPAAPPRPKDGPFVINPNGKAPKFTLKDDRFVPADEVKAALDDKRKLVIIDARAASDWSQSRIPGSISVPYYQLDILDDITPDDTWYIAYCACPHHASGVVVDELLKRGFKHAAVLDEGINVWKQRGYPIAGDQPKPADKP